MIAFIRFPRVKKERPSLPSLVEYTLSASHELGSRKFAGTLVRPLSFSYET